jgi:hypothetical protein
LAQDDMMTELDALIEQLGKRGFLIHGFHVDMHGPDIMAAVFDHGQGIADVLILFDETTACAYRTPTGEGVDVFNPTHIYWWYGIGPVHTLRALLTLPPPGHPQAPVILSEAPRGYGLPSEGRTPVRVRASLWHGRKRPEL